MSSKIVLDLSNAEYHASTALSNSGVSELLQSPLHYYGRHLDPERPGREDSTASQLHGTLAHCAILEPDEFDRRYIVGPSVNRNTKVWHEFVKANQDRVAIQGEQRETALRQAEAVHKLPEVARLVGLGEPEVSVFWTDPETGIACRCRPDYSVDHGIDATLLDVKTCGNASPQEFARQVARMGYHRQDAWYSMGYEAGTGSPASFIFIAVETEWPFAASACRIDAEAKARGLKECRVALTRYAQCMGLGSWPGYSDRVETISLPRWILEAA